MQAIGFIETIGLVTAVEAADSAMKAASVSFVDKKSVGGGLVTVILTGDVAAVKAGVETGCEAAAAVGQVVSSDVIARPHADMEKFLKGDPLIPNSGGGPSSSGAKAVAAGKPAATPAGKAGARKKSPGV
jgi:ethanolamine utilization protein EutM